jgi:hypothetical protein
MSRQPFDTVRTVLPALDAHAIFELRFSVNLGGHGLASVGLTFGPSRPPLFCLCFACNLPPIRKASNTQPGVQSLATGLRTAVEGQSRRPQPSNGSAVIAAFAFRVTIFAAEVRPFVVGGGLWLEESATGSGFQTNENGESSHWSRRGSKQ